MSEKAPRRMLSLVDQPGSETRTSWARVFQIDGGDASLGIRTTPDASHLIRMRSMVAIGGGTGSLSLPWARVLARPLLSMLPVIPKWPPRAR